MVCSVAYAPADRVNYTCQVLGLEVRFQNVLIWKGSQMPEKRYRRIVASPYRIVAEGLC